MRKIVNLNNLELNPILDKEIQNNLNDILEFCPECTSVNLIVDRVVRNKANFEVKILLKGPGIKMFSSSKSENVIDCIVDCKRKILNQFKRHRNKTVLERRRKKARHIRDTKFNAA